MAHHALEIADAGYDDSHKAFLHAFMARQVMTFEEAKPILAEIFTVRDGRTTLQNDVTYIDFVNHVRTINNAIEPFGYEIHSTHPQNAKSRSHERMVYAFVNTVSDPQTQLATTHSADAIAFVKRLLDAMFDTNNTPSREVMAVKEMDAVRLYKNPRNRDSGADASIIDTQPAQPNLSAAFGLKQAEETISSLVQQGWLEKSSVGFCSLSPRALMELRGWLEQTYNDPDAGEEDWQRIKKCNACKNIITSGQRCADHDCNCRLHTFCAQSLFSGQSNSSCPTCRIAWTGKDYVGEKASRGYQHSKRSSTSGRARQLDGAADTDSE